MKFVVFDFDGTLTKKSNEIWRNIWTKLDALDVDDMLYNKVKNGELNYEDWTKEITKEYIKRGFNSSLLNELTNDIQMMDNLDKALNKLIELGYADDEKEAEMVYHYDCELFEATDNLDAFERYLYFMEYYDNNPDDLGADIKELKRLYERHGGHIIQVDDFHYLVLISYIH